MSQAFQTFNPEDGEGSLASDKERERRLFGTAISSLSSSDFDHEHNLHPTRKLAVSFQYNDNHSQSSRVVQYQRSDHNIPHSRSESPHDQQNEGLGQEHCNTFLHRLFARSELTKHPKLDYLSSKDQPQNLDVVHSERDESSPLLSTSTSNNNEVDNEIGGKSTNCDDFETTDGPFLDKDELFKRIQMASIFLTDYERARPPTLPTDLSSVSKKILRIHGVRYSWFWRTLKNIAVCGLFLAASFEGNESLRLAFSLNTFAIITFSTDVTMRRMIGLSDGNMAIPMIVMMAALVAEMTFIMFTGIRGRFLYSSMLKPIALFCSSNKARDAFSALIRIVPIVIRVLALELLLILSFAAVACRLYSDFESFETLQKSWLSLFQLSTTVVNPSIWMPMYAESRKAAFFFIIFVTTATLYVHSLVLSVVFQTYIQASTEIHERSITDREDAIRMAFLSLQHPDDQEGCTKKVRMERIQQTLAVVRPHYNAMKINALVEIFDPERHDFADYPTFRTKIRQALNASIRSTPSHTLFAYVVEITATFVAVCNFIYVILLTSAFHADWFDVITVPAGFTITMLGLFELMARANPFHFVRFTPSTRLNGTFDGLAALAAAVSCWGLIHYEKQLDYLLTGRAIDMIRIMRFYRIFRDVVRRSGEVIPALAGPLALVVSTNHFFVYLGMAIWGGAIEVGTYENISPLYDLNNFNSYTEGLVTMFQILIVNDWHAIAQVYLFASKNSSYWIVYPFFIGANLVSVSIMLNCLTAFFVGAFVTKLDDEKLGDDGEVLMVRQKERDFNIDTSRRSIRKISGQDLISRSSSSTHEATDSQFFDFNVFERETFDKIMQTVGGGADHPDSYAKKVCEMLELFDRISPRQSNQGYLVCCQQTMNRFGNQRFQALAEDFMEVNELHAVVSSMHVELMTTASRQCSIKRNFAQNGRELQITAALLRQHPAVSLMVSAVCSES